MARLQRVAGLLRALGAVQSQSCALAAPLATALLPLQQLRCSSSGAPAPAATSIDIADEWYSRQRSVITLGHRVPHVSVGAWVAPNAVVIGDVDLLDRVSIWHNAVLRGDLNNITVGSVSNIQARSVVHAARTSPSGLPASTKIGNFVTIEPSCVLRSCRIGNFVVVGARSVLCEGSLMEPYTMLAPGSVLPPARRVPEGELWAGTPARFVRKLTGDEKDAIKQLALEVRRVAYNHSADELPHGTAWRAVEEWRSKVMEAGQFAEVDLRTVKYQARKEQERQEAAQQL